MHHAHSGIAVPQVVAQDAHTHEVVDVVELASLDDHLLIDRPVVLGPALDGRRDARSGERVDDVGTNPGQVGVSGGGPVGDETDDLLVTLWVQDGEGEVFEFPLDGRHAQSMS